jgi:hypothetical protein
VVDLIDRGPEDDAFTPASANETIFHREWRTYHNTVPDVVELGYQGNAAWGSRITIPLKAIEAGDLLSWICIRLQPRSWLGPDLETKLGSGSWDYNNAFTPWMWATSLGSIAIESVEFEVGDAVVEKWPGEWIDVWSRLWIDAGRAASWDADIYGQMPVWAARDSARPPWTTFLPTEDGFVYCWLPLAFLRRPQSAFPLLSTQSEMRLNVRFRPFSEVIRRRGAPRTSPTETPLGSTITLVDKSGPTPIPYDFVLPTRTPTFEDITILAGVVHTEDPLRSAYLRTPLELLYEPVTHMRFDVPEPITATTCGPIAQVLPLRDLNGPIRELVWFIRRKAVWQYNEWTNYGALLDGALGATASPGLLGGPQVPARQEPLMTSARLFVGNAIWRSEAEYWWRAEVGLAHRGGVRAAAGMVYGFSFGEHPEELQPSGTVNASRADIKLEVFIEPPKPTGSACTEGDTAWEIHVFAIGVNWMRFVNGLSGPLFR